MDPKKRASIKQGMHVAIVLKHDQESGRLTDGVVLPSYSKLMHSSNA